MALDCVTIFSRVIYARKCLLGYCSSSKIPIFETCRFESVLKEIMAVFNEDWHKTKASITERGIFTFNNDLLSDVSLVVPGSSDEGEPNKSKVAIPAHKIVLSICSPVFFSMFCGELAEKSDSVDLPDCEYEGVLEMLRYMYSGKAELNENNVMQVLYVAKKYILPSLGDECARFLKDNLNTENVFCVLSHAQQYDEKVLVDQCWEMIDRETPGVMKSEEFVTIERSLLEEIVKRDTLTITEVDLFKAVDLWASKKCGRQGLTGDGNVKRKILGEKIIKEIRFPVMEEKEFASVVLASEMLTSEEVINIMKYFNSVTSSTAGFLEKRRVGTFFSCCRYDRLDSNWTYLDPDHASIETECIDLKVDKDVLLHGVRMFGSENSDYLAILRIIESGNQLVVGKSGKYSSEWMRHAQSPSISYYGYDILFNPPVFLKKGIKYSVKAIIDGPDSFYATGCHQSVQSHGVTFSFSKNEDMVVDDGYLRTGPDKGQFAEFLFRPK